MKYALINQDLLGTPLSVSQKTSLLVVDRSGYYKWLQKPPPEAQRTHHDMRLRDELQQIAVEFPRYGYRRMTVELHNRGYRVNHKKVLRLMNEDNLLVVKKRFKPLTTDSNHPHKVYPNLIKHLTITQPDQVWASDITYIQLTDAFVYLSVILDLFSRKCIGWQLGRYLDTQLALDALDQALHQRWNASLQGLIHHSDQGVQYASTLYVNYLRDHQIRISMSGKGNPYDNAFVESFMKTFKYEEVYLNEYHTYADAYQNIRRFIDDVYNKKRLHLSLGYKSPDVFEQEVKIKTLT